MIRSLAASLAVLLVTTSGGPTGRAADALPPASARFAEPVATEEVPDFQRHVLPLMGRLGCNGRACHGSFQGQGGFRLSLFGYDFESDHEALLAGGDGRVAVEVPERSMILEKPTLTRPHEGGQLLEYGTWQYEMIRRWIEGGAEPAAREAAFDRLEVIPAEVVFSGDRQSIPLKAIAHWSDGTSEDVTCLTRFQSNDDSIAEVDPEGVVTSVGAGDTYVIASYDNGVVGTQVIRPVADRGETDDPEFASPTEVDRHIAAKLGKLGIVPSEVCTDAEFLRRVSLDLTGSLPAPDEVRAFVADEAPEKRSRKVDEVLERPTYAAWWTNLLCDITGASPDNLRGLAAGNEMARHWYEWIYERVEGNTPYDELVSGIVLGTSREPGQDYDDYLRDTAALYRARDPVEFADRDSMPYFWARRNLRQPEEKALAFSYAFLGVRLECAQCHKHPFDQWTQDDFNQFTAFFRPISYGINPAERDRVRALEEEIGIAGRPGGEKRREIAKRLRMGEIVPFEEVYIVGSRMRSERKGSASRSRGGRVFTPRVLGGDEVTLTGYSDPREPLMEWLRGPENPYFAQAFVNRVWENSFGRGIIDPPDDMNLANPPSNPALLDSLTRGFISSGYDMKWLHREIANSLAYQRSWRPNETNRLDDRNFSRAVVRRLPAEVLLDAVSQVTAEPGELAAFAVNADERSFGPRQRAGGGRGRGDYAGRVFGRSTRDTNCDCSRSDEPNLLQLIYLQNDRELHAALDRRDGWVRSLARVADDSSTPAMLVEEAFLRTLSREPDAAELASSLRYFEGSKDARDGLRGLIWALMNTKEFMTNH
ncbi:DUF1549 and DUF1553 domain-containing protein [Tautonia plasticadhaerens]|uniref:BIG2 domain-containing protein n=1 Tax=Tautonia plasticadhaerens TaxID=2527974 RepID=A0A518H926_9BACT|nr:DUF1549 and DUF1553 domain-containing protein [Tautonia plasticadhaerens]QDV37357.1 hypothetical protein ElP_52950 [Tautonia plasticadhaerens]